MSWYLILALDKYISIYIYVYTCTENYVFFFFIHTRKSDLYRYRYRSSLYYIFTKENYFLTSPVSVLDLNSPYFNIFHQTGNLLTHREYLGAKWRHLCKIQKVKKGRWIQDLLENVSLYNASFSIARILSWSLLHEYHSDAFIHLWGFYCMHKLIQKSKKGPDDVTNFQQFLLPFK